MRRQIRKWPPDSADGRRKLRYIAEGECTVNEEHRYTCVLDRDGWRITLDVYTPRPVTKEELLGLAIERAVEHLAMTGIKAQPDEFKPVGFREAPAFQAKLTP